MNVLDIMFLTFVGRSLSGAGGFGGVYPKCNATVLVARIKGILRIGNILAS